MVNYNMVMVNYNQALKTVTISQKIIVAPITRHIRAMRDHLYYNRNGTHSILVFLENLFKLSLFATLLINTNRYI